MSYSCSFQYWNKCSFGFRGNSSSCILIPFLFGADEGVGGSEGDVEEGAFYFEGVGVEAGKAGDESFDHPAGKGVADGEVDVAAFGVFGRDYFDFVAGEAEFAEGASDEGRSVEDRVVADVEGDDEAPACDAPEFEEGAGDVAEVEEDGVADDEVVVVVGVGDVVDGAFGEAEVRVRVTLFGDAEQVGRGVQAGVIYLGMVGDVVAEASGAASGVEDVDYFSAVEFALEVGGEVFDHGEVGEVFEGGDFAGGVPVAGDEVDVVGVPVGSVHGKLLSIVNS